jgi:hypothetical protein
MHLQLQPWARKVAMRVDLARSMLCVSHSAGGSTLSKQGAGPAVRLHDAWQEACIGQGCSAAKFSSKIMRQERAHLSAELAHDRHDPVSAGLWCVFQSVVKCRGPASGPLRWGSLLTFAGDEQSSSGRGAGGAQSTGGVRTAAQGRVRVRVRKLCSAGIHRSGESGGGSRRAGAGGRSRAQAHGGAGPRRASFARRSEQAAVGADRSARKGHGAA